MVSPPTCSPSRDWKWNNCCENYIYCEKQVTYYIKNLHNSKNPKLQLWVGEKPCLSLLTFWSASDTESKNLSPNIRYGGVTTLAQNTSSFQEVSTIYTPRQRHLVLMRTPVTCSWGVTIQVENETIAVRSLLYIHNSKNPKLQLWVGGCLYLLISKWHWIQKT